MQASAPPSWVEKGAGYRGVRPASYQLQAPCGVAAFLWNRWQLSPGIDGRLAMESVAALPWNQWQDSPGIGGIFGVEYAMSARRFFRRQRIIHRRPSRGARKLCSGCSRLVESPPSLLSDWERWVSATHHDEESRHAMRPVGMEAALMARPDGLGALDDLLCLARRTG